MKTIRLVANDLNCSTLNAIQRKQLVLGNSGSPGNLTTKIVLCVFSILDHVIRIVPTFNIFFILAPFIALFFLLFVLNVRMDF